MLSLVWFKRDLRVADHPALALAAAQGAVLPVYIIEPDLWAQPDASGRQWAFVAECLQALRRDLAALGQPLILREGDAVEVLARLHAKHRFAQIVSHEETGNGWSYARDLRVAAWARDKGLPWVEVPQSGVIRRLVSRDGWAERRNRFMAQPLAEIAALQPVTEGTGALPSARSLRLAEDPCPYRQQGGRAAGMLALESFTSTRGQSYRSAMSSPLAAERACSRLSPYLAFGALSGREVVQDIAREKEARRGQGHWRANLRSFDSRLAWRDHFMQKLEDQPALETRALHSAMEGLHPSVTDAVRLQAWQAGETGLPFVDACMRYLRATGWINFRMRAMLQAIASYHLWLDWRVTGLHLARLFTDYEPGIHWSQVQMQSGTTGINALRIYDPVKQGHDQDPKGQFIRRWVPELAPIPDSFVHEPWKWPQARQVLAGRYPEPVIDPAAAARAARAEIARRRHQAGFHTESARVVARHGSRKAAPVGPRARQGPVTQMMLDL
ncbi:MAG: deoxyribodipyrimidine photo-lyase [Rhodobacteraceae bacterium]|jgi:deoxyribodipyrimidine photo-lyase|nr:deoxyribodipyrimidine photo-lyase [Paracoccaceae bacterium]